MTVNVAVTERLADWLCSESHDRLPATVKDKTVDVIFDAVGCMVACSALPEVNAIVEFVVQQGGQHECTIIGRRATTAVVHAAMANGQGRGRRRKKAQNRRLQIFGRICDRPAWRAHRPRSVERIAVFARLAQTEDWRKDLENNLWENHYMGSSGSRNYLDSQYSELRRVLSDLGMAK